MSNWQQYHQQRRTFVGRICTPTTTTSTDIKKETVDWLKLRRENVVQSCQSERVSAEQPQQSNQRPQIILSSKTHIIHMAHGWSNNSLGIITAWIIQPDHLQFKTSICSKKLSIDLSHMFYGNFDRYNLYLLTAPCKLLIGYLAEAQLIPGYL